MAKLELEQTKLKQWNTRLVLILASVMGWCLSFHDEVDAFFNLFEKTARLKGWPDEEWVTLTQGSLTGRAQRAYATLTDVAITEYNTKRQALLKAFKLVLVIEILKLIVFSCC